jgi:Protein of unknown function (DUF3467)
MTHERSLVSEPLALPPLQPSGQLPRYANNVNLNVSAWDFTITFTHLVAGPIAGPDQEPEIANYLVERIVMSPQHTKAFLNLLTENVARYEERMGEVAVPQEGDLDNA